MSKILEALVVDKYRVQLENAVDALLEGEYHDKIPRLEKLVDGLERIWRPSAWVKVSVEDATPCVQGVYRITLADFKVPLEHGRGLLVPMWQFSKMPVDRFEEILSLSEEKLRLILDKAPRIQVGTRCCGATIVDFDLREVLSADARFTLALALAGVAAALARKVRYVYLYPTWRGAHIYLARDLVYDRPISMIKPVKVEAGSGGVTVRVGRKEFNFKYAVKAVREVIEENEDLLRLMVEIEKRLYLREEGHAAKMCERLAKCVFSSVSSMLVGRWVPSKFRVEASIEFKSDISFLLKYPPTSLYLGYEGDMPVGWNGSVLLALAMDEDGRLVVLPVSWTGAFEEFVGWRGGGSRGLQAPSENLYAAMFLLRVLNFVLGDSRVAEIHGLVREEESERLAKWRSRLIEALVSPEAEEFVDKFILLDVPFASYPAVCRAILESYGDRRIWARGPFKSVAVKTFISSSGKDLMKKVKEAFRKGMLCLYPLLATDVREGERFKHLAAGFDILSKARVTMSYNDMVSFCVELTRIWGQEGWARECLTKLKSFMTRTGPDFWEPKGYHLYKFYEDIAYFPCPFCRLKDRCLELVKKVVWNHLGYILDFDLDNCVERPTIFGRVRACRIKIVPKPEDPRIVSKVVWRLTYIASTLFLELVESPGIRVLLGI